MRVVKIPDQTAQKPAKTGKRFRWLVFVVLLVAVANTARPLPNAVVTIYPLDKTASAQAALLSWPNDGQAAVAAEGFGVLQVHGVQTPIATASIAKVVTALCVLQKHPLKPGQKGPKITLKAADYNFYQSQIVANGSLLPVYVGQQIDEYTALQALMIPSANNIADSLAIWAFGSIEAYSEYANAYVHNLGMKNTVIGIDASGYDPSTKSTASDLTILGIQALKNPILMEIAGQKSAYLPGSGLVYNYNTSLGQYGINGLKTGNNAENLGGLLFTQEILVGSSKVRAVGAVIGENSLYQAIGSSTLLAESMQTAFSNYDYGKTRAGEAKTAWGSRTSVLTKNSGTILRFAGSDIKQQAIIEQTQATTANEVVGTMAYSAGATETSTPLVIDKPAAKPSIWWRLTRGL